MPRGVRKKAEEENIYIPKTDGMSTGVFIGILVVVAVATTGSVIFIGKSDAGQIDVTAAIQNSSQNNTVEGEDAPVAAPSEAHRAKPNGGLVPQNGDAPLPPPVVEEHVDATTTATSTDSETTEENTEEGGEEAVTEETAATEESAPEETITPDGGQ